MTYGVMALTAVPMLCGQVLFQVQKLGVQNPPNTHTSRHTQECMPIVVRQQMNPRLRSRGGGDHADAPAHSRVCKGGEPGFESLSPSRGRSLGNFGVSAVINCHSLELLSTCSLSVESSTMVN